MPTVDVYNLNREKVGEMVLSDRVFAVPSKPHLYYDVVRAQLLSRRRGTVATKKRSMVSGSTRKVYRQKGTGLARHGDSRAPLFRRGGVVFGPQPREWNVKVPKKVRKAALASALSDRLREGCLWVLDNLDFGEIKTKRVAEFLGRFNLPSALLVDTDNRHLSLSCRNLPKAKYLSPTGLNVYDVLKYQHLVITKRAVEAIEGVLTP